ncbi:hypothetical protein [Paenibacillus sp. HB172176]|uniref:hypothetical protein n=1 Tax=Paenibacillus sp. HB172176 TaxID=2493690 RepID=UPI0014395B67|nr:hypothetical protein [Paenibacillus sp. HB172176]
MFSKTMQERMQWGKRNFKSGQCVLYEGLYVDEWGDRLHLVRGDLFPVNPQMGATRWAYRGEDDHLSPAFRKSFGAR